MNYEVGLDPPKRDASEWPPFGMCSHALKSQESGFFTVVVVDIRRGLRKFIKNKRVAKIVIVIDRKSIGDRDKVYCHLLGHRMNGAHFSFFCFAVYG